MKNLDELILGIATMAWSTVYAIGSAIQLAQVPPAVEALSGGFMSLLTQFGGLGLAVWLVYIHTTKTIPEMLKEHQAERAAMVVSHSEMLEKVVKAHAEELERKRQDYLTMLPKLMCRFDEKED